MRRVTAFLASVGDRAGAGFQLIQSFIALGAGGGWGVGLGEGRQKMYYLPQAHTDFIFAVVGEEFGILGGVVVVALFCVILFRGMKIAHDEPDPFASLLAVGLTASLSFQALINMAVVIGLIPTKGLPLPFLSYGGTAIMMSMAALGALLALGRRPAVQMKVIIAGGGTGGHLFPAVALGEELVRERPDTEVLYVGTRYGFEAKWLPKTEYRYELYDVHGLLGGRGAMARAKSIAELMRGRSSSRARRCKRFGADLVVIAGGYASAPMGARGDSRRARRWS